jgi:hypothetical protein
MSAVHRIASGGMQVVVIDDCEAAPADGHATGATAVPSPAIPGRCLPVRAARICCLTAAIKIKA